MSFCFSINETENKRTVSSFNWSILSTILFEYSSMFSFIGKIHLQSKISRNMRTRWTTLEYEKNKIIFFRFPTDYDIVGKLAAFYFFFYITLAGFFCLYLSIIMIFLPLNQPRYIGKDSRLASRLNPLSPGVFFSYRKNEIDLKKMSVVDVNSFRS